MTYRYWSFRLNEWKNKLAKPNIAHGINKPGWEVILKEQISPLLRPFPPGQTLPCTAIPRDWAVWSFQRWKHVSCPCIRRWGCTEAHCLQGHRELCGERGVSCTAAGSFQPEHCLFSLECNILPVPSEWHCTAAGSAVGVHWQGNNLCTGNPISQKQHQKAQPGLCLWMSALCRPWWQWLETHLPLATHLVAEQSCLSGLGPHSKHCAGDRPAFLPCNGPGITFLPGITCGLPLGPVLPPGFWNSRTNPWGGGYLFWG